MINIYRLTCHKFLISTIVIRNRLDKLILFYLIKFIAFEEFDPTIADVPIQKVTVLGEICVALSLCLNF